MRILEGQLWKVGAEFWRVVYRDTVSVTYKSMLDLETKQGTEHEVSKKEFCRLVRKAELLTPLPEKLRKAAPEDEV